MPEVRSVIEKYEEKSPLYGLVQYRRKKVILKYVPEGTSRLLQGELDAPLSNKHQRAWLTGLHSAAYRTISIRPGNIHTA